MKLLDSFFEYVAVREQRERLGMRLSILCVTLSACYAIAVLAYLNLR